MILAGLVVHLINTPFTHERPRRASLYDYKMQWFNFMDERVYTPIHSDARQYPNRSLLIMFRVPDRTEARRHIGSCFKYWRPGCKPHGTRVGRARRVGA